MSASTLLDRDLVDVDVRPHAADWTFAVALVACVFLAGVLVAPWLDGSRANVASLEANVRTLSALPKRDDIACKSYVGPWTQVQRLRARKLPPWKPGGER